MADFEAFEIFLKNPADLAKVQGIKPSTAVGPKLRFILPYDAGVFLYAKEVDGLPLVSDVQIYLDLVAHGARHLLQAERFLETVIEPHWARW